MADNPVSDLEAHVGYWLRLVSNAVSQGFARKLEAEGVTPAEWVALRRLYDADAVSPSRLAEQLGMTKGAISKLADRLTDKGLATRIADPDDGRAHALSLTAIGRAKTPTLAALADQNDAESFTCLDADERATLERMLRKIVVARGLSGAPTE